MTAEFGSGPALAARQYRSQAFTIGRIRRRPAQHGFGARIRNALRFAVEAAGHRRQVRRLEGHLRRRLNTEQSSGVGHHRVGRAGIVVGDIVNAIGRRSRDGGEDSSGDVVDVDAVEDLTRLDDAPGSSGLELIEGAAARTVNAGKTEDRDMPAPGRRELQPLVLGQKPPLASLRDRRAGRRFVDPSTTAVAINTDGREVAEPRRVRGRGQVLGVMDQHGIAGRLGRNRREDVRRVPDCAREGGARLRAVEDETGPAAIGNGLGAGCGARRAGDPPARGRQGPRHDARAVAQAEEQHVVHAPVSACHSASTEASDSLVT